MLTNWKYDLMPSLAAIVVFAQQFPSGPVSHGEPMRRTVLLYIIIIIIIQYLYSAIMSYADTEALVAPV